MLAERGEGTRLDILQAERCRGYTCEGPSGSRTRACGARDGAWLSTEAPRSTQGSANQCLSQALEDPHFRAALQTRPPGAGARCSSGNAVPATLRAASLAGRPRPAPLSASACSGPGGRGSRRRGRAAGKAPKLLGAMSSDAMRPEAPERTALGCVAGRQERGAGRERGPSP